MEVQFIDRTLFCSDCHGEFIFTAGEQLFFHDKQFKNDPKRCKPCKSRRGSLADAANDKDKGKAGLSRTETRTECSQCGVETTVPFKPTQGRAVLCRQCFQLKNRSTPAPPAQVTEPATLAGDAIAVALTSAATDTDGATLSADAAVAAAASMASAMPHSSVATAADLASISASSSVELTHADLGIPSELLAAASGDFIPNEQMGARIEADEA